jgi:hypothetical protein
MKVITPGQEYFLDHFEDEGYQVLSFIHKEQEGDKFVTIDNGTTNEEVLAVLIDRMQYLNTKAPCRENSIVITKLEESLMWLNKRTADRKKRGVEGTPKE